VRALACWASLKGHPADPGGIPSTARNTTYRFSWLWPNKFFEMLGAVPWASRSGSRVSIDIARMGQSRSDRYGLLGAPLFEPRGYGDLKSRSRKREAMESVQWGSSRWVMVTGIGGLPLRWFHHSADRRKNDPQAKYIDSVPECPPRFR
jgi:hypothetical protein